MNPEARRVSPATGRVVHAALEGRFKLETSETRHPDEAIKVAADAVAAGNEFIVAFGGDGLVNEVVNGIQGTGAILAVIPGGTMNVFARNLGLPKSVLDATDFLLERAGKVPPRTVELGGANGRLFTFACGCGFDADAASHVEMNKPTKWRFGEPYFFAAAFLTFAKTYIGRAPFLRCRGSFGETEGVAAIALNGGTYAYLAGRPLRLSRSRAPSGALDLFVLKRMAYHHLPAYAVGAFASGKYGPSAAAYQSLDEFEVSGNAPFPLHVDGEPLPPVARVEVRASAGTIPVLA